jgi:hypothetical protein
VRPELNRIAARLFPSATLIISCIALLTAASAGAATSQVNGVQSAAVTSGPCFDPSAITSYTMAGGLVGCWYTDTLNVRGDGQPNGTVQATGTEHFVGCLDLDGDGACGASDPSGTLTFSFQFSGKYDPVTGAEIHGRCQHPVTSATGDFTGATGVITFKDDVANGTSLYEGHVAL